MYRGRISQFSREQLLFIDESAKDERTFQVWCKEFAMGPLHDPVTWYRIIYTGRKLRSGTFKTKAGPGELVRVALFWKSHCATCVQYI